MPTGATDPRDVFWDPRGQERFLGVLSPPDALRRAFAAFLPFAPGLVAVAAGVVITALALGEHPAEGVPKAVPVVAGLVFVCGGVLATLAGTGRADGVVYRTLVALLITGFAVASIVFPPSLLFTVPLAVMAWIAVGRIVVERVTGRHALGHWSQERELALGCGVTIALVLLVVGALWLRSEFDQPAEAPPVEEPPPLESYGS